MLLFTVDDRFKKFSFKFGDEASVQPLPDLRFYVLANGVFKDKAVAYLISPLIHQSYVGKFMLTCLALIETFAS